MPVFGLEIPKLICKIFNWRHMFNRTYNNNFCFGKDYPADEAIKVIRDVMRMQGQFADAMQESINKTASVDPSAVGFVSGKKLVPNPPCDENTEVQSP